MNSEGPDMQNLRSLIRSFAFHQYRKFIATLSFLIRVSAVCNVGSTFCRSR